MDNPINVKEKYYKKIQRKISKTIFEKNIISGTDSILIGLSGGKDSLVMLDTLANIRKSFKQKFNLYACHIMVDSLNYAVDHDFLKQLCNENNVELIFENISVDFNNSKGACFVCSWARRKKLFDIAKNLNCNKIALGHHMDDAVETMFMNMIYHASVSSMPFSLPMLEGKIAMIRPMLELRKTDIVKYFEYKDFPNEKVVCKYSDITKRQKIRELLANIESFHKDSQINFFRATNKVFPEYLPYFKDRYDDKIPKS